MPNEDKITYFAEADYRNKLTPFGIKASDRTRHMYVIGKTGMGKSTLLENMAIQDLRNGEGMAFIDPHGGTAELLLDYVPEDRVNDVIYFAPFDTDYPVAFNIMEDVGHDKRHLVASGLMSAFKKIWVDAWSARMEYILGNTLLALLEFPGATLLGVNRMYSDKDYRKKVVDNITDPSIKSFWVDEYAKYGDRYTQEATPAIQNKIGQFVANPLIRNIIGQPKSTFDIRQVMDEKKILIMNLSKGKVGDQNTSLLGSMLITKIYLAAMSRADATASELGQLPNFYFFVDEFQSFANESFADILSEARKYKLNLTIAHQYIEQMPEEVRAAVFGNVGTMITFRVGSFDAEVLEKEFLPAFTAEDIVNLDKRQIYLRLMIDGVGSKPFSAVTLSPIPHGAHSFKEEIIAHSREFFGRKRAEVEEEILNWHKTSFTEPKPERPKPDISTTAPQAAGGAVVPIRPPLRSPLSPIIQTAERAAPPMFQPRATSPVGAASGRSFQRTPFPSQDGSRNERRFEARRPAQRTPQAIPLRPQDSSASSQEMRRRVSDRPRFASRNESEAVSVPKTTDRRPAPMSLNALRKESSVNRPEPTQNRNTLKEALSGILSEAKKAEKSENKAENKDGTQREAAPRAEQLKEQPVHTPASASTRAHAPKEIPEDVLRGMLSVDEEKE
ncbi:MAG: type IV secretion system DNA-binding domain-containing protein [Parcubacteria group bacterium]|nr:type IV secretion system DNA-binding domain-containing protein [Parcubacteria group bacterium]